MADRTIHARTAFGTLIVRYDKASKWYAEDEQSRTRVTLAEAVSMAARRGSYVYLGKPGGKAFDARLRATIMQRVRERAT